MKKISQLNSLRVKNVLVRSHSWYSCLITMPAVVKKVKNTWPTTEFIELKWTVYLIEIKRQNNGDKNILIILYLLQDVVYLLP